MRSPLLSLVAVPFLLARSPVPGASPDGRVPFPFVSAEALHDHAPLTMPLYRIPIRRTFTMYLTGITSPVTVAGTYRLYSCVSDNDATIHSDANLEMFRGSTRTILASGDTFGLNPSDCVYYDMAITAATPDFQLKARNCYNGGTTCFDYDSLDVDVNVTAPSVTVSGPQTRGTGEEGQWTANPSGGTGPYTYEWGGDVFGEDQTLNWTWYDEAPHLVGVTVTDANGLQGSISFYVYVCLDVCDKHQETDSETHIAQFAPTRHLDLKAVPKDGRAVHR